MENLIYKIIVHYSETKPTLDIGVNEIREWHTSPPRNWKDVGYHIVTRRNGVKEFGRPYYVSGAHTLNHNRDSLAVCWIGGTEKVNGNTIKGVDNRTDLQKDSLIQTIEEFCEWIICQEGFLQSKLLIEIGGHRDYQPMKETEKNLCPGFNAREEYKQLIDKYNEKIKNQRSS
jgi:hypothetical protein